MSTPLRVRDFYIATGTVENLFDIMDSSFRTAYVCDVELNETCGITFCSVALNLFKHIKRPVANHLPRIEKLQFACAGDRMICERC